MTAQLARSGFRIASLAWIALFSAGCVTAGKARLTQVEPARVDVSHVRSLCVLPFSGKPEHGSAAQAAIVDRLRDSGVFQLVDPAELQAVSLAPLYATNGAVDRMAALEAARRRGVDAVLVGEVKRQEEGAGSLGPVNIRIGEPRLAAAIAYELIDVRSGQTLVRDLTRETFEPDGSGQSASDSEREKIYRKLTRTGAEEVAYALAPHRREIEVSLATTGMMSKGAGTLRKGNELANGGDWTAAMASWQKSLDENPDNDAAYYNLGLAHEARGDYEKAREMYVSAAEREDQDLYRQAIERAKKAAVQRQLAWNQIDAFRRPPGPYAPYAPFDASRQVAQAGPGAPYGSYPAPQAPSMPPAGNALYGHPSAVGPPLAPGGGPQNPMAGWPAPGGPAPGPGVNPGGMAEPAGPWPANSPPAYETAVPNDRPQAYR